jgi:hypothetical protein|tara:strand:- start:915 stop:1037 length:123 start_codon:yes stop_codon:yes gene_type:complete
MGNWKNRDRKVGKRKAFSFKPHKKNSPSPKKVKSSVGRKI